MTNASIYFHPDGYNTSRPRLMGRHAAGESFLRGFLRHADVEAFHFFKGVGGPTEDLEAMIRAIEPATKPLHWLTRRDRARLHDPGCLYHPGPSIPEEAWRRRPFGAQTYSLCGVTHTTATHRVMDTIAELATSPLEPWDALICTSQAVRASVETQLSAVRHDLTTRLGATRLSQPKLATIPLGVNVSDFTTTPSDRQSWRARLDIPSDAVVALFLGRFSAGAKMNPALMAMTLEAAAQASGREIYWIVAGWANSEALTEQHHAQTRAFCPSIHYRPVDGRTADARFGIWSAADFFLSFSENIQETFGLTPVEAMAAGLPCVVTDWDGYRDTVRHGVDGFRVPTFAPRPGLGRDLAFSYANEWISYDDYIAAAAQMTAIDLNAATQAVTALVTDAGLRVRMGQAAAKRAREVFDWSAIIPQYQALWRELADIRAGSPLRAPLLDPDNPRRLDPFRVFASYPTHAVGAAALVSATPGMSWSLAEQRLAEPLGAMGAWAMPLPEERRQMFEFFATHGETPIAQMLSEFPAPRRPFLERGVLWLVKFGILRLSADGPFVRNPT